MGSPEARARDMRSTRHWLKAVRAPISMSVGTESMHRFSTVPHVEGRTSQRISDGFWISPTPSSCDAKRSSSAQSAM